MTCNKAKTEIPIQIAIGCKTIPTPMQADKIKQQLQMKPNPWNIYSNICFCNCITNHREPLIAPKDNSVIGSLFIS